MALRSGYKGYKKLAAGLKEFWPGILGVDNAALNKTFIDWSSYAMTGAVNALDNKATNGSNNNVSWVVNADKSITITANNSSADTLILVHSTAQYLIPEGSYYAKDFSSGIGDAYLYIARKKGASGAEVNFTTNNADHITPFTVDYSEYDYYYVAILVKAGKTFTKTLKPMFTVSANAEYAPYAMTNEELTKAVTKQSTQCTDIIEGATVSTSIGGNYIEKNGNVVTLQLGLENVTITAWTGAIAKIPEGFRPSHNIYFLEHRQKMLGAITTGGSIQSGENLSDKTLTISATWII